MDIKKFLKKMAQMADFQQAPVEPVVEAPIGQPQSEAEQGVVEPGVSRTGPLSPFQEAPQTIQTTVAEWHPSRGRNKGQTYHYLQLINVPDGDINVFLTDLGYKFNAKIKSWSKQAKADNDLSISGELDNLEKQFNIPINRDAINQLQEIFGFNKDTTTEMGTGEISDDVSKIKFVAEGEQQDAAEALLKSKLEEMVSNLNSDETKAFLEQYLSVKKATEGKVHPYSFLNNMLISWQNFDTDVDGKRKPRSGFIAPASIWKKEFGREINPDAQGMEIFVPKGGQKTMKGGGQASLLKALGQFSAMNRGNADLTNDDNVRKLFGFLKSLVAKKQMYQSNYSYLVTKFNKNREQFKTVKDIQNLLGSMLQNKEEEKYYTQTTFMIKPVIFDADQTTVIPGQEHKDPKPKMDAIRGMWLGMKNEPDKLIDTLYDALANAATNGILIPGKNINIKTEDTGSAGGYSSGGEIAIEQSSAGERRFRVMIHEAAHEILHWGQDRPEHTRGDKEIDADATAYIVLNHYGVGTGAESLNYISLITQDKKVIMNRLKPILTASNAIISSIDKQKGIEYDMSKNAKTNWYSKFKIAHYSEPEQKGEGRGGSGTGQFGERRLGDWDEEHREEVEIMANIIKRQDWTNFAVYKQKLMEQYNSPQNKTIVDGIVSAAMKGQRF